MSRPQKKIFPSVSIVRTVPNASLVNTYTSVAAMIGSFLRAVNRQNTPGGVRENRALSPLPTKGKCLARIKKPGLPSRQPGHLAGRLAAMNEATVMRVLGLMDEETVFEWSYELRRDPRPQAQELSSWCASIWLSPSCRNRTRTRLPLVATPLPSRARRPSVRRSHPRWPWWFQRRSRHGHASRSDAQPQRPGAWRT